MPIQARHAAGIPGGDLYRATDKNGAHGHQAATRGSGRSGGSGGSYSGGIICRYAVTRPLAGAYGRFVFWWYVYPMKRQKPASGRVRAYSGHAAAGTRGRRDPLLILSHFVDRFFRFFLANSLSLC